MILVRLSGWIPHWASALPALDDLCEQSQNNFKRLIAFFIFCFLCGLCFLFCIYFMFILFIYLSALGLAGPSIFVAAFELLVAVCGIYFPDQDPAALGAWSLSHPDHQGSLFSFKTNFLLVEVNFIRKWCIFRAFKNRKPRYLFLTISLSFCPFCFKALLWKKWCSSFKIHSLQWRRLHIIPIQEAFGQRLSTLELYGKPIVSYPALSQLGFSLSPGLGTFPRWHSGKEFTCQCRKHRRHGFNYSLE